MSKLVFSLCFIMFCFIIIIIHCKLEKDEQVFPREDIDIKLADRRDYVEVDEKEHFESGYSNVTDPGLLNYLRKHWILSPSKLSYKFLEWNKDYDFSQYAQCKFVDELLSRKTNGFFIESGAANGIALSNTVFFEVNRNWTGILIEPNPLLFNDMLKVRRHAYLLNSCINTKSRTDRLKFIPDILDSGLKGQSQTNPTKPHIVVQCFPLVSIVFALGNPRIDYLSLDVEGPELDILGTVPFNEIFIDIIGIEYRVMDKLKNIHHRDTIQKLKDLRLFFNQTGLYDEVGILPLDSLESNGVDVMFKRKQLPDLP